MMAYSNKINDPCFKKHLKNTRNYNFIFSFALGLIALTGFYLYGEFSNDMDNPQALYVGMVIGGMFFMIGIYSAFSGGRKPTWDGIVIEKKIISKADKMLYNVYIEKENKKIHELVSEDDNIYYEYYKIGDKVRYHGKLGTLEKFDKTNDKIIFCNACAFMNYIEMDKCALCGCVLLK